MHTWMLGLVGACSLALLSSRAGAWQTNVNGTLANPRDEVRAVTVDGTGNIVAAGVTENIGTGRNFTVVKFDGASGVELWRQVLLGTAGIASFNDMANAITVDAAGNVVAAGATANSGTGRNFTVVKFDGASGVELWRQVLLGTAVSSNDVANVVTVDAMGNVVAAGVTSDGCMQCTVVVKLDGVSGAELWRQVLKGTGQSGSNEINAVSVDAASNVVAAGATGNSGTGQNFTVVKFDGASGVELWRQVLPGTASTVSSSDAAHAVSVDSAGNVVAAGATTNTGTSQDVTVIKLDGASGAELWRQVIAATGDGRDVANAVSVDSAGNVVAAGRLSPDFRTSDFLVIKLDGASGVQLWRQALRGSGSLPINFSDARAVTVDAAGNVVAAGMTASLYFTVVKFDGASGVELWRQDLTGTSTGGNATVTVDAAGNVIAAGETVNSGTGNGFTVLKVDGISGAELLHQVITGTGGSSRDAGNAVTVDSTGHVVAAGVTENTSTGRNFTVVKVDGASGVELWRQVITGTDARGLDTANALTVDSAGNVIAAGVIRNSDTDRDFTVIKFEGASGAELWRQVITGTGGINDDAARAVTVDSAGDVVAAGAIWSDLNKEFIVLKMDGASGTELWRQVITGTSSGSMANVVTVDGMGNIVAAGTITNTDTNADFTVIKFDGASGAELWRQVLKGTVPGNDVANAVTVDATGNVVAAGVTVNSGAGNDFTVVKFDGASGAELWRQVLNGTCQCSAGDVANAVTVDATGNVVAAGTLYGSGISGGFTVIKFDGASGAELWRQGLAGTTADVVKAVTVDGAGNVVAVGVTVKGIGPATFAVIKFDGASGAELWRQVFIGTTPSGDNVANAVTVDRAGNVVTAGVTVNAGTGQDFTVVKLRGTDGGDFEASVCGGTGFSRLRGRVRAADPAGVADVTLTLRGPDDCRETTTTNGRGHYRFRALGPGTYTVTPTKEGCTFAPAERAVTIAGQDIRARFRGTCP